MHERVLLVEQKVNKSLFIKLFNFENFFEKLLTPTQRNSLRYVYREEEMTMMTVNEVSKLTGVSIRTLQYYDTIGLLKQVKSQSEFIKLLILKISLKNY